PINFGRRGASAFPGTGSLRTIIGTQMYYWPASGFAFKRGVDKAVDVVVKELRKLSKPTKDAKEIAQVGTISANPSSAVKKLNCSNYSLLCFK
ncbi:MAG TPA: hypothetical protein VIK21_02565, partial [Desulfuromonadaceae bacterium]